MRIINDLKLDFQDLLLVPHRSELTSRKDADLYRSFKFKHSKQLFNGIPIITANMTTVSTFNMAKVLLEHGFACALHKFYTEDELVAGFVKLNHINDGLLFYTTGISDNDLQKFVNVYNELRNRHNITIKAINIDVANGYTEKYIRLITDFRCKYPDITIMAGTVCTPEVTEELLLNGADLVRGGIGGGSGCHTRKQTGVGYPQASMIIECADAAHGLGGHIVSDGGCVTNGDLAKAFGLGADFIMAGAMFAGHTECDQPITEKDGKQFVPYYGMSSFTAMNAHYGKVETHRTSEGRTTLIPFKGDVINTINDIKGSLASTCTYIGAKSLKELPKRATFIRVNPHSQLNTSLDKYTIAN